jgi:hypothetical protein
MIEATAPFMLHDVMFNILKFLFIRSIKCLKMKYKKKVVFKRKPQEFLRLVLLREQTIKFGVKE